MYYVTEFKGETEIAQLGMTFLMSFLHFKAFFPTL